MILSRNYIWDRNPGMCIICAFLPVGSNHTGAYQTTLEYMLECMAKTQEKMYRK